MSIRWHDACFVDPQVLMLTTYRIPPSFSALVPVTLFRRWMVGAQHDIDGGGEIRPAAVRFQRVATDEERRALRLERLHDDMRHRRELRRRIRRQV